MSRIINAEALEPGMAIIRTNGVGLVFVGSVVKVMGDVKVRYEKPDGTTWHCSYLPMAQVEQVYTEAADDMPEVLAAKAALQEAEDAAYKAEPFPEEGHPVWGRLDAAQEALSDVLAKYRPKHPCNCEHVRHTTSQVVPEHRGLPRDGHPEYAVPAGHQRAAYVGEICDTCASTCLADYLIKEA